MSGELLTAVPVITESHSAFKDFFSPGISGLVGVLFGALITGIFNYFGIRSNNSILLQIKEKEIESNKNQLLAQLNFAEALKKIEDQSARDRQTATESHQYKMRILDEKLKAFSDLNECMDKIYHGGSAEEKSGACKDLYLSIARSRILVPRLNEDFINLRTNLSKVRQYFRDVIDGKKASSQKECDELMKLIKPLINKIRDEILKEI